jgi:hypothetical protein
LIKNGNENNSCGIVVQGILGTFEEMIGWVLAKPLVSDTSALCITRRSWQIISKRQRKSKGQSRMDNPETQNKIQHEPTKNRRWTQVLANAKQFMPPLISHVVHIVNTCWTPLNENKPHKYDKQLEVKSNRTSFSCENRSGHHNTELKTERHM